MWLSARLLCIPTWIKAVCRGCYSGEGKAVENAAASSRPWLRHKGSQQGCRILGRLQLRHSAPLALVAATLQTIYTACTQNLHCMQPPDDCQQSLHQAQALALTSWVAGCIAGLMLTFGAVRGTTGHAALAAACCWRRLAASALCLSAICWKSASLLSACCAASCCCWR